MTDHDALLANVDAWFAAGPTPADELIRDLAAAVRELRAAPVTYWSPDMKIMGSLAERLERAEAALAEARGLVARWVGFPEVPLSEHERDTTALLNDSRDYLARTGGTKP